MKSCLFTACFLSLCCSIATAQNLAEKLGYPKDTRLLIVHADDLGLSHSENSASTRAMETGTVSSASIMMPAPWVPEIAEYARLHPQADLGLHLTLTSEWKYYKWKPVTPATQVPGLVNTPGFLYSSSDSVSRYASAAEVKTELVNQVEKAKRLGIDPTHFDTHMGTVFARNDFFRVYLELGLAYKVPVLLNREALSGFGFNADSLFRLNRIAPADHIISAGPADFASGMAVFYTKALQNLQPGLSVIIIHTAYDDTEMQAITIDHADWGAAWRQADFDFFSSEAAKKIIREQKIQLITWREIRDKLMRE